MPRKPRYLLPGVPCHIVQRGNNRQATFFCETDYRDYHECVAEAAAKYSVSVHAYVFMTNHVHLLATGEHKDSISRMMQSVGRKYVRYVNAAYQRSGTLFEGRFKASLIDSEHYLLSCYRYIELNPVRAGMVASPGEYPWSSYHVHAFGKKDNLVTDHEVYLRLSRDADQRRHAYRELFRQSLGAEQLHAFRESIQLGVPVGSARFREEIEEALGRKISYRKRGRPRKVLEVEGDEEN